MNKRFKQQHIQQQQDRDTNKTNAWLKSQGLSAYHFTDMDIVLLQAQQIAYNCLKHHGRLLDHREAEVLNHFLRCFHKKSSRQRIKPAQAYKVMNTGTSLNRRVFKQYKQTQAK